MANCQISSIKKFGKYKIATGYHLGMNYITILSHRGKNSKY